MWLKVGISAEMKAEFDHMFKQLLEMDIEIEIEAEIYIYSAMLSFTRHFLLHPIKVYIIFVLAVKYG